jgi:hypothetical protein
MGDRARRSPHSSPTPSGAAPKASTPFTGADQANSLSGNSAGATRVHMYSIPVTHSAPVLTHTLAQPTSMRSFSCPGYGVGEGEGGRGAR